MNIIRAIAITAAAVVMAVPAAACDAPKATLAVCGDPRVAGVFTNNAAVPQSVEFRFVSHDGIVRHKTITIPAERTRVVRRWSRGGTVAWVTFGGERIAYTRVDRETNVGSCAWRLKPGLYNFLNQRVNVQLPK